jgi:hypothetical protein
MQHRIRIPTGPGPHAVRLSPKQTDIVYELVGIITDGIIGQRLDPDFLDEDKQQMRNLARKLQDHTSYDGTYDLEDRVVEAYDQ